MNKHDEALTSILCEDGPEENESIKDYVIRQIVEEACAKANVFNIISQNFRLVGNCLHAKNEYAENGWVFVKEIIDEEELEVWEWVLKNE